MEAEAGTRAMQSPAQPISTKSHHESAAYEPAIEAIRSFVAELDCELSQYPMGEDQELLRAAENEIRQHVTSEWHCQELIKKLHVGEGVATDAYPACPFDVRLYITLYTTVFGYIDDANPEEIVPKLERFAINFGTDTPHSDSNLDYLQHLLVVETPKFWGPLACSCIIKATLDLLAGCTLEDRFPNGFGRLAMGFPSYLRYKTGASEAYAFFCFPESLFPEANNLELYVHTIPGIIEVGNSINDVMSYYKEFIRGKDETCRICSEAKIKGR